MEKQNYWVSSWVNEFVKYLLVEQLEYFVGII